MCVYIPHFVIKPLGSAPNLRTSWWPGIVIGRVWAQQTWSNYKKSCLTCPEFKIWVVWTFCPGNETFHLGVTQPHGGSGPLDVDHAQAIHATNHRSPPPVDAASDSPVSRVSCDIILNQIHQGMWMNLTPGVRVWEAVGRWEYNINNNRKLMHSAIPPHE